MDYCSNALDLGKLSPHASNAMISHGVASSICGEYDEVTLDDLKEIVSYLNASYCDVQNQQLSSGKYSPISKYAKGKLWLIYCD
jgi:hypothetical protein